MSTTKEDGVVRHFDVAQDPNMRYIADEVRLNRADPSITDNDRVLFLLPGLLLAPGDTSNCAQKLYLWT